MNIRALYCVLASAGLAAVPLYGCSSETSGGAGGSGADIIEEENDARRKMYERLAKKADLSEEAVIERMVKEIRRSLPNGQSFKAKEGEWIRG